MVAPKYELSAHAAAVMAERDIDLAWVEQVITHPERLESAKSNPGLTSAVGRIAERDGRVLRVVYNANVEPPRVVTVYFDRGLKGKL